jgi:hypothetical protein
VSSVDKSVTRPTSCGCRSSSSRAKSWWPSKPGFSSSGSRPTSRPIRLRARCSTSIGECETSPAPRTGFEWTVRLPTSWTRSTYLNGGFGVSEGERLLAEGTRLIGKAAATLSIEGACEEAGDQLRRALSVLRSAMNWLEDSDLFDVAHERIDVAGRLAREHFPDGCAFSFRDGTYFQECPAALAHNRMGMSIGYVVREAECSICHQEPEDCDHIKGQLYDGQLCVRIIKRLDLMEVSFVGRPAQPDARVTSVSIDTADMHRRLGPEFRPGMSILCDKCLSPCSGLARPFESISEVLSPG